MVPKTINKPINATMNLAMNKVKKPVQMFAFLEGYQCLVEKCKNTCCKDWTVDVDHGTIKKWAKATPELLEYVEPSKKNPNHYKMKMTHNEKDDANYCNLYNGKCQVHSDFGIESLPNTCKAYPFLYRRFFDNIFVSATLSCSAIVYLIANENEDTNFKIINANHYIKKDENTIPTTFSDATNQPDSYLTNSNIIKVVVSFFDSLIQDVNKCVSIKQMLARFLNLCVAIDGENIKAITTNYEKNLQDAFLLLTTKDIFEKANIKFRPFYNDLLMGICDKVFYGSFDFSIKIKTVIKSCIEDNFDVEEGYYKYKRDENVQKMYFKYLRRFFKAKLAENLFPFGVRYQSFKNVGIVIVVEMLIIELLFALFHSKDMLNQQSALEIMHFLDRDFYGKSEQKIMDIITQTNLDKIENLFCCLIE